MIAQVSYADKVASYVKGVLDGSIPAGKHNILAVKRYLDDLEHAEERGFYFDEKLATRGCRRFPIFGLHTVGNQFAGNEFHLEPWQAFIIWNLWGWRRKSNGLRRFKKAYITVAAKSGKTTFAGVLAWICTVADYPQEAAPQTYIVATKLDQAKILYDETVSCASAYKATRDLIHVYRAPHRIEIPSINGLIRPIPLDGNFDGFNASYIFVDEMHAMREPHREGKEKLRSRTLARSQPLEVIITTAGNDKSQLWKEEDSYAVRVVESVTTGNVIDDTYFSLICRLDDGDDIFEERNWYKANPSLGVTVSVDTLKEEANRAKKDPASLTEFMRYKCNIAVSANDRAISAEQWAKGNQKLTVVDGAYGHGGIDASTGGDFFSVSMVFPVVENDVTKYEIISRSWCLKKKFEHHSYEPWASMIRNGQLRCHDGEVLELSEIEEYIMEMNGKYFISTWALDPAKAQFLGNRLIDRGANVFHFKQNSYHYNEPCRKFVRELDAGNVKHGNDPVLSHQFSMLTWEYYRDDLIRPSKSNNREKIDAPVSTLMAFSECLFAAKNKVEGSLIIT